MKKRWIVGMVATWVGGAMLSTAAPGVDGDWQVWLDPVLSVPLAGGCVKLEQEWRIGDDAAKGFYTHTDLGFSRAVVSWFEAGANIRVIQEQKSGSWKDETRPYLNGTFKGKAAGWKVSDRNRLEYRSREGADDVWRYRNKLTVHPPSRWFHDVIKPYLADEVYLDLHGDDWVRNRVYAGFVMPWFRKLDADIGYIEESNRKAGTADRAEHWEQIHVVQIKATWSF